MPESEDGRMAERVVHISPLTEDGVYVMALESGDQVLACVASAAWLRHKDGVHLARRAAAAPDMEKALETWLEWDGEIGEGPSPPMLARAALAKAGGETPKPEPTKGSWRASQSRAGQPWSVLDEYGRIIAKTFESETNARRMAAVPDREKALEGVLGICGHCLFDDRWKPVQAALAKAKGE